MQAKKIFTVVLIAIFFLLVIFIVIFLESKKRVSSNLASFNPTPTLFQNASTPATVFTTSVLSMRKRPGENKIDVMIDSGTKAVSAVQLDISYDPQVLGSVTVSQGNFFGNPVVLSSIVDKDKKNIFYAVAIPAKTSGRLGQGVVMTISYTPNLGTVSQTTLKFLSRTKVTTLGLENSILKQANDFTLSL